MNIKKLHNYTLTQAGQILLLNYDEQVAKDARLIEYHCFNGTATR